MIIWIWTFGLTNIAMVRKLGLKFDHRAYVPPPVSHTSDTWYPLGFTHISVLISVRHFETLDKNCNYELYVTCHSGLSLTTVTHQTVISHIVVFLSIHLWFVIEHIEYDLNINNYTTELNCPSILTRYMMNNLVDIWFSSA